MSDYDITWGAPAQPDGEYDVDWSGAAPATSPMRSLGGFTAQPDDTLGDPAGAGPGRPGRLAEIREIPHVPIIRPELLQAAKPLLPSLGPLIEHAPELTRMAANVPGSAANIPLGLASMGHRALRGAGNVLGGLARGPEIGPGGAPAAEGQLQRGVEDLRSVGVDIGHMIHAAVREPASFAMHAVPVPDHLSMALATVGWTPEQWRERMADDPVGTGLFTVALAPKIRAMATRRSRAAPPQLPGDINLLRQHPRPEGPPRAPSGRPEPPQAEPTPGEAVGASGFERRSRAREPYQEDLIERGTRERQRRQEAAAAEQTRVEQAEGIRPRDEPVIKTGEARPPETAEAPEVPIPQRSAPPEGPLIEKTVRTRGKSRQWHASDITRPEDVRTWVRSQGGIAADRNTVTAGSELSKELSKLRVRSEKGRKIEDFAEELVEAGMFEDTAPAVDWIVDTLRNPQGAQVPGRRRMGSDLVEAGEADMAAGLGRIREGEIDRSVENLRRFGVEPDPTKARTMVERAAQEPPRPATPPPAPTPTRVEAIGPNQWRIGDKVLTDKQLEALRSEGAIYETSRGEKIHQPLPGMEGVAAEATKRTAQERARRAEVSAAERTGQGSLLEPEATAAARGAAKERRRSEQAEADTRARQSTIEGAEDYGAQNKIISSKRYAEAVEKLKRKSKKLHAGVDPTAVKELVEIGVYHAEALARRAADGVARFEEWTNRIQNTVRGLFDREMSAAQLHKLWNQRRVRLAKETFQPTATPAPEARGTMRMMARESGPRGELAYHEWRRARNRIHLGQRMVEEHTRKRFKGLKRDVREEMTHVARGIGGRNPDGSYRYGTIARAGERRLPRNPQRRQRQLKFEPPGTVLPDGRMVGPVLPDGRAQQLYRVVWPQEARAAHNRLRQSSPKAAELLDEFLATEDGGAVYTVAGDRLPSQSRTVLKEQYGVEGLTVEEAHAASMLARKAFGQQAKAERVPNEMSWVPELGAIGQVKGVVGRLRNAMRDTRAGSRKRKTGAAAERAREGAEIDFAEAMKATQKELFREQIHNDMAARVFALVAEPIRKGETLQSLSEAGYSPLSLTGLYGESAKFRRFVKEHREYFESAGIDVPDVLKATYLSAGKGYKVPSLVADKLAPLFRDKPKSVRPGVRLAQEAVSEFVGEAIATVNVFRLTRVSTAVRNLLSNKAVYAAKALRDFYEGVLNVPGVWRGEAPFAPLFADLRALGTAHTKGVRERIPPEALGSTFLMEMERGMGSLPALGGRILRYTGFNYADVYTKRAIVEAVVDASARQAWAAAKKAKQTDGLTKAQYIARYKEAVPKSIEQLAYREMDMWGGYDYANVPQWIESMKRSKIGRSVVPYPTYYYKLFQTYRELYGTHNVRTLFDRSADVKARKRAAANLLTGATIAGVLWTMVDDNGDLPEGVKESDLPYDVQRHGRVKVPLPQIVRDKLGMAHDDALWVRLYDMPFLGEVMAAKAIMGKDYTLADYVNDRIALGPLFNTVAITGGLSNRFNQHMPRASRMGREVGSWFPFAVELSTVRKLTDPWKREQGDPQKGAFRNFFAAIADGIPVLSTMLPERVQRSRLRFKRYHPMETSLSWGLLNTHIVSERERKAAIALAEMAYLEDEKKALDTDRLRENVRAVMDAMGETEAGRLKYEGRTADDVVEAGVQKARMTVDILREFDANGYEAAKTLFSEAIGDVDEQVRGEVRVSMKRLLNKLRLEEEKSLTWRTIRDSPVRVRSRLKKQAEGEQ